MDSCCEDKVSELAQLRDRQSRVLYIVLVVNAVMFLVEFAAGWIIGSTALLADSLDMFGDASIYALTLYVLHRSVRARAGAALVKGIFMLIFGLVVVGDAVRKMVMGGVPEAQWMGLFASAALIANTLCFALLFRHRSDDLNMKSTWLCSRNDLIANSSVIVAAILVGVSGSFWPDVIVGLAIATLFLHSARQVLAEAWSEWRCAEVPPPAVVSNSGDCCDANMCGTLSVESGAMNGSAYLAMTRPEACPGPTDATNGAYMRALENRIPPPIITVLFAALMWLVARHVPSLELAQSIRVGVAVIIVAVGLGFVLAGVLSFRRAQTTVNPLRPETTSTLVSSGVYNYTRNPMYLGFALFLLAWACFLASPMVLLGPVGFVLYMNRFQISPEERALERLFGAEFQSYRLRVRRWC